MKKLLLLIILQLFIISCGSSKNTTTATNETNKKGSDIETKTNHKKDKKDDQKVDANKGTEVIFEKNNTKKVTNVIDIAKTFEGTKYKFGGTTKSGMDCSGLVYTAFREEDVTLPRISRDMATKGTSISLNEVTKGDLVFFKINKKSTINHVGLVIDIKKGEILFIHSTTSKGVIISSMEESYWKQSFVEVRRII